MSVKIGNSAYSSYGYVEEGTDRQKGILVTAPADGTIPRLGAWLAGWGASRQARMVVWDGTTRAVLGYSDLFTVAHGNDGECPPNGFQYEADLISAVGVTNGQSLMIGVYCTLSFQYPVKSSGSTYEKVSSGVIAMTGADAYGNAACFYAYLVPVSKPNPPTTESYGVVDFP